MSSPHAIFPRLEAGRPIILGGDPMVALRGSGIALEDAASVGRILRETPEVALDYYVREIASGVDVLAALTTETTPRALGQIGMAFRAAALTSTAIDLAQEAAHQAPRAVAVAGVLGPTSIREIDRLAEEYATHAARLVVAGCEVILARGGSPDRSLAQVARTAAIASASATELPTWGVVQIAEDGVTRDGEPLYDCACAASDAGANVLIFETDSVDLARRSIERATPSGLRFGVLLAASGEGEAWAQDLRRLVDAGARVIGGGPGTAWPHVAALARVLGRVEGASSLWPRAI